MYQRKMLYYMNYSYKKYQALFKKTATTKKAQEKKTKVILFVNKNIKLSLNF